tara:strand:+ start:11192 stop:11554 length:363 start_codon:yes stop_codon:yes gene_type:complete
MPRAIEVEHKRWTQTSVLIDTGEYSYIYGYYQGNAVKTIGMRWNGKGQDAGYPKLFKRPVWFNIPQELTLPTLLMLSSHLALTYAGPVLSKNGTMTKAEFDEYTINIKSAIANCREGNLL